MVLWCCLSQAPMSSITSGTTATDVTGCVAPLGHRHEGYEVMYAGDQAAMLPNSNGEDGGLDTRMVRGVRGGFDGVCSERLLCETDLVH